MPDLILHGDEGIKRHENEKCVSCQVANEKCPLIKALVEHTIESFAGIHIFSCGLYKPDTGHPLFVETQAEKNLLAYEEQIARLRKVHARTHN